MPQGTSKNELYLCFFTGIKPGELVALGFKKPTVYHYFRRYNKQVKPSYDKLIRNLAKK